MSKNYIEPEDSRIRKNPVKPRNSEDIYFSISEDGKSNRLVPIKGLSGGYITEDKIKLGPKPSWLKKINSC